MEVGNKNMADAREFNPISPKLYLGTLATVDKKKVSPDFQHLGGWIGQRPWSSRIAAENR